MQTKIKLFVLSLAVLAVVSVLSFFDVFTGIKSALIFNSTVPLSPVSSDADNDGLLNAEESYWDTDLNNPDTDGDGFIDGEEVSSGHDPRIPGPDDRLADKNITEKMANLALGGLMEGSLKADNPNFDSSMESLALSVFNDGLDSFAISINPSRLNLIGSDKESQKIYAGKMDSLWETLTKALKTEIGDVESKIGLIDQGGMANPAFVNYFIGQKKEFDQILQNAVAIPVPKNWINEHTDFLNLVSALTEINSALARGKDDPIRAAMAFNLFIQTVENYPTFLEVFVKKLESENLNIN